MSEIFNQYPEQPLSTAKTVDIPATRPMFTKRELKVLKAFAKQIKRYNKSQKKMEKLQADKKDNVEKQESTMNNEKFSQRKQEKSENKSEKTFLEKLGDVFLKVLPGILCTAAQFFFTTVAGRKFKWRRSMA